jgi:Uma2 family endonuclease
VGNLNRESLDRGIEPDSCFYIQNAEPGQGLETNVTESLSPDLVLEVDIANSSASKMAIYRAMEVPEIWLFQRNLLKIQLLQAGQYVDVNHSRAFPMVSAQQLNQWLELWKTETDLTVLRDVQRFCRTR